MNQCCYHLDILLQFKKQLIAGVRVGCKYIEIECNFGAQNFQTDLKELRTVEQEHFETR